MNQDIINEIKNQDYASITETIEKFLSDQIEKNHAKGVILGLSGGIDSAVLAYICKRKLKEKTLAIIMPDTSITPTETEDALKIIALTGIEYKLIDINPIVMNTLCILNQMKNPRETSAQESEPIFCITMQIPKTI